MEKLRGSDALRRSPESHVARGTGASGRVGSDALVEAGFSPKVADTKQEIESLLASLAELTRRLGHFPSYVEAKFERRANPSFPTYQVLSARLGHRVDQIEKLRRFASERSELVDVLQQLPAPVARLSNIEPHNELAGGAVYLLKLGKHYKLGHTTSVPRRHRQIALELPEKPELIHVITTDDPTGIEAYWHNRFAQQRTNGEWFQLTIDQVRAFKRRRTM